MDLYIFNLINGLAGRFNWLDNIGIFFAKYFEYVLFFGAIVLLIISFNKYKKIIIQALVSAVLARFIIVDIIRWIWARPRPFVDKAVNLLIDYPDKASFPSGHASFYFALSFLIYLYNKKIGTLFLIGSFLICLGRIFVGVHWPSDILFGALIGMLSAWLIYFISKKLSQNKKTC